MSKILKAYYIYGEDDVGNFTGNFKVGDYVKIKTYDKDIKCVIKEINEHEDVKVEDDEFEEFTFCISEILEIYELFC